MNHLIPEPKNKVRIEPMRNSLIAKEKFIGLEDVAHLAVGGESPMLKSHLTTVEKFFQDKSLGENSRELQEQKFTDTKEQCAQLFSVNSEKTFLDRPSHNHAGFLP